MGILSTGVVNRKCNFSVGVEKDEKNNYFLECGDGRGPGVSDVEGGTERNRGKRRHTTDEGPTVSRREELVLPGLSTLFPTVILSRETIQRSLTEVLWDNVTGSFNGLYRFKFPE